MFARVCPGRAREKFPLARKNFSSLENFFQDLEIFFRRGGGGAAVPDLSDTILLSPPRTPEYCQNFNLANTIRLNLIYTNSL